MGSRKKGGRGAGKPEGTRAHALGGVLGSCSLTGSSRMRTRRRWGSSALGRAGMLVRRPWAGGAPETGSSGMLTRRALPPSPSASLALCTQILRRHRKPPASLEMASSRLMP